MVRVGFPILLFICACFLVFASANTAMATPLEFGTGPFITGVPNQVAYSPAEIIHTSDVPLDFGCAMVSCDSRDFAVWIDGGHGRRLDSLHFIFESSFHRPFAVGVPGHSDSVRPVDFSRVEPRPRTTAVPEAPTAMTLGLAMSGLIIARWRIRRNL